MNASGRESLIIATLFGSLFLATVDNQLLIPLFPVLASELGVPMARLGWLLSVYALAAALFSLLLGPLTDRFGRVPFLRAGLGLLAVTALLTSKVESYGEILALRTVHGLAGGLLSTVTASFVGDYFPYQRRGRVMGIVLSSYFAALVLGIPAGAWIAETWSWRLVFLLASGLAVLLLALTSSLPGAAAPDRSRIRPGVYLELLRSATTRWGAAVSFLVSGGTLAFLAFISGHLHEEFGLRPVEISWLFLTAGMASIAASPISGRLADAWTKRRTFLIANTVLAALLPGLDGIDWGAAMIALFFLVSVCVSFRQTALHTVQTELVDRGRRGAFLALRNASSQLGISASVFVAGLLYADSGYGAVTLLAALLTLGASLVFYAAIDEPGGSAPVAGRSPGS